MPADTTSQISWTLVFDGLMSLATVGLFIIATRKSRVQVQQPVDVRVVESLHQQFPSRKEFDKHIETFTSHRSEIWQTVRGENQRLDNEITVVRTCIAGLQKATDMQNVQLTAMSRKIDDMPDRVIATLKNTGAI